MGPSEPNWEYIIYERREGIARIVLNRPPVNAINPQMASELNQALLRARRDEEVRAVIIAGAGDRAFSAGIDLRFFKDATGLEMRRFLETFYWEMTDIQYSMGKPTIAALNGPALAAGVTVACSCDMIIASERALIGYPEINVGLIPALHLILLPRVVGRYKAFELAFTGDPIDAREALRLGLVNQVVAPEELDGAAWAMAQRMAAKPPLAVKYMRDAFYRGLDMEFRKAIANAADVLCILKSSEDSREGLQAFVEKRPPRWKGR